MTDHRSLTGQYYIRGLDRLYIIRKFRRQNLQRQSHYNCHTGLSQKQTQKVKVLLDLNQKGVRFKSRIRPCDECGFCSHHDLFYYKKSNRGRVFICQTCLSEVQTRSWQFIDALNMSWQGGAFNPR